MLQTAATHRRGLIRAPIRDASRAQHGRATEHPSAARAQARLRPTDPSARRPARAPGPRRATSPPRRAWRRRPGRARAATSAPRSRAARSSTEGCARAPAAMLPAATAAGNVERLSLRPREAALDDAFGPFMFTRSNSAPIAPERVFVAGRHEPGSRRTRKRLGRYRTGAEGRIGHLKRGYGLRRSRLKSHTGQRTWTAGRSWPTTSTRSPSTPPETIPAARTNEQPPKRPPVTPGAAVSLSSVYVASAGGARLCTS
jgi:hypothetical protein